ncbi:MAG: ABC transporter ATP-binding protein [Candidatus Hinthialibacter antarcticus]|nr:ABC transporter ATP-binding protein [Candidatus Hinthialibacter antarcticus]
MLTATNLTAAIGRVEILKGVSFHVNKGEIVTFIGANGAGKSTLLNVIAGLLSPQSGRLQLEERDLMRMTPTKMVRLGVALVPEGRQLFSPLSVIDNLVLGAYTQYGRKSKDEINEQLDMILSLFPILQERKKQLAGTLSGGEQQMLAIGRALMSGPKLLLLDEPSIGLAPRIIQEIFSTITELQKRGMTILLVEQNARLALDTADRGYVMETGQIVMEGDCEDLKRNQEIERAYMGKGRGEIWE